MNAPLFFGSAGDERGTPQDFFDALNAEFHFDLDAAARKENAECPTYYTSDDDALSRPWRFFDCGCLLEVRPGVPLLDTVLFAEQIEQERLTGVVSKLLPSLRPTANGLAPTKRSNESFSGETQVRQERKGTGSEASQFFNLEQQTTGAASSLSVDLRDVGEVSGGLELPVRPLQQPRGKTRTRSRDTALQPKLSRHGSVEHIAGMYRVQPSTTSAWSGLVCPVCGLPSRSAIVYLNGPYSTIGAFVAKAREEANKGATVVMLLPVRSDTKWWHRFVYDKDARRQIRLPQFAPHITKSFFAGVETTAFDLIDEGLSYTDGDWRPGVRVRLIPGRLNFELTTTPELRAWIKTRFAGVSDKDDYAMLLADVVDASGLLKMAIERILDGQPDDCLMDAAPFPSCVVIFTKETE